MKNLAMKVLFLWALIELPITHAAITEIDNTLGSRSSTDTAGNLYLHDFNVNAVHIILASYTCSVANADCQSIQIIDGSGDGLGNILDRPAAVATDSSGNVYVVGQFSDNVFRILNPFNCIADCIREIVDINGASMNGLNNPSAITVDIFDNVYVSGASSDNVIKISASETCATTGTPCNLIEIIDSEGDDGIGSNELGQPVGLASDSQGNVFVTTQNSDNVFKIATPENCNSSGTCTITELVDETTITDQAFGRGIIVDSQDNVYFTSIGFSQPAAVFKINTPGTCSTSGTACTITEIFNMATPQQASSMAVDDADNIYFAGGNGDNAFKIDTPTNCSTSGSPVTCTISEIIDINGDGNADLDGTSTVSVAFGQIYVTGGSSDNTFRITDVAVSDDLIFYNGFE